MDEAIINYVKRKYNMLIGERTAEQVKMTIATASAEGRLRRWRSRAATWSPAFRRWWWRSSEEIAEALVEPIHQIVETVHLTLEKTPPELAADIVDRGIMLVGGGSLLRDFDHVLRQETKLPILRSDDPFTAVVHGAGKALENLQLLKDVALS